MRNTYRIVLIGLAILGVVYAGSATEEEITKEQQQKQLMEAAMRMYGMDMQELNDLCVMLAALEPDNEKENMTTEEKNKLLVKVAIGAINAGDWEYMSELYSPRFVQHHPGNKETINWADFELACRVIRQKMPTTRIEIEDIIAEGDKVAVRLKTVVTYKETFEHGTREAGKIEFTEMDLFRIEGGRIVEECGEYDTVD